MPAAQTSTALDFVRFALNEGVLRFGSFKVKSGRISPYFFNAGLFNSGASVGKLASFYAQALLDSGVGFDMLFGPAYRGSRWPPPPPWPWPATRPCRARATCRSPTTARKPRTMARAARWSARRRARVVIIDDVITAGTSVRESVEIIRAAGAEPAAVLIAMDRMERAGPDDALSAHSAVQDVAKTYGIPVVSIASLADILALLQDDAVVRRAPRGGAGLSDQVRSEVRRGGWPPVSVSAEASGLLP